MKHRTKLTQNEQHQPAAEHNSQHSAAFEFASAEDLLRHDAAQTPVPPAIGERLRNELVESPQPKMSWWQRWFGGPGR
jgi:hypothetical protein